MADGSPERPARAAMSRWLGAQGRGRRMLVYLVVLGAIAAWRFIPRPWHPTVQVETAEHTIYSTATRAQTEDTGRAMTLLYAAYSNRLGSLPGFQPRHPKLKVRLYRDRAEMRRVNPGLGWAEAYYRKPFCHAYFSANEINPYHWMLHEAVHQLNREVAGVRLARWLEEGLAEYFSTSRLGDSELRPGEIDPNTYPVWWLDTLATSPDLDENLRNGSVIPLRAIITDDGGPAMRTHFNLYYLHWWSLTHFLSEHPRYRDRLLELVRAGADPGAFERMIGPIDQVQPEWHAYVRELKKRLP